MTRRAVTRHVFFWLWLLSVPAAAAVLVSPVPRTLAVIPLLAAVYSLFVFLTRDRR